MCDEIFFSLDCFLFLFLFLFWKIDGELMI